MSFSGNILYEIARILATTFRIEINPDKGVKFSVVTASSGASLDQRLKRIESAKHNLTDALEAMNELQQQAEESQRALTEITRAIDGAEAQREQVTTELASIKSLAALDSEAVRKALGVPTRAQRWAERIIAFFVGVLASLAAAAIIALFV